MTMIAPPEAVAADLLPASPSSRSEAVPLYLQLDIAATHLGSGKLASLAGWVVAGDGYKVTALGLRVNSASSVLCNYPFRRSDVGHAVALAAGDNEIGFNAVFPERAAVSTHRLNFVVKIAKGAEAGKYYAFGAGVLTDETQQFTLSPENLLADVKFEALPDAEISQVLENRLFDHFAVRRHVTLRMDLINKCNLRCVMCHYSNDLVALRPAQRILPDQFAAFFEPIEPIVKEVVLSCGDEPLMSPHFETIVRELKQRAPEVTIRFCTNGMLLSEKIAQAIVATNVRLIMFSFDGVQGETLHRIRVGSNFQRIIKNIVNLRRLRESSGRHDIRFVFNFVMMDSNIHEAPLFVEVAKRLGGSYVDFRHAVPANDFYLIEHELLEYNQPKFNYYRELIALSAAALGMEIYLPPPFEVAARYNPSADPVPSLREFNALLQELGDPSAAAEKEMIAEPEVSGASPEVVVHESAHYFCDRPFSEIMIREQREVYPCPWHKEKMGELDGTQTLEGIFFGENFKRVRLAMLTTKGAPGCEGCPVKTNYLPIDTA